MDRVTSMTVFTTIVVAGSFTAAAHRLNISPAVVTTHVRALEERLSARLLNRTTRKISLTEAGKAYYDQCAHILAEIDEAERSVADLHAKPQGRLKLNAANVLAQTMAPLIGSFTAAYPDITVELITTDGMVDLLAEGIDVAVRFNQVPDSSLIARRLGAFRIILCAAPSYIEEHGTPGTPGDLAHHHCIAYMHRGFDRLTREWTLNGPEGEVTVPISGRLHTNSLETLVTATLEGRGIAMALSGAVDGAIRAGRLVRVLPEYHAGEFPIIALYPHRQHLPAKVRCFVDFAAQHFARDSSGNQIDVPPYAIRRGGPLVSVRAANS